MDVLSAITATSLMFQNKDLLIFEVKEAIDTLYTRLHLMTVEPGEQLNKFYSLFDKDSSLFNGYLKRSGNLPDFKDDNGIHGPVDNMGQYVLNRFSDLSKPPVADMMVFDFGLWPHTLSELSSFGNSEIKNLCQHYSDVLTDEEVKLIPSEWQTLKVQVSMQRQYHPLAVYSSTLQRKEDSVKHVAVLLSLILTVAPSKASCERLFSNMNLVKSSLRSRLTQEILQNQMRIVVNGKSLEEYDPEPAVQYWLSSANRHITHKKPVKPSTSSQLQKPCTSAEADLNTIQPMLNEMVKVLGGGEAAMAKLKALSEKESGKCSIM